MIRQPTAGRMGLELQQPDIHGRPTALSRTGYVSAAGMDADTSTFKMPAFRLFSTLSEHSEYSTNGLGLEYN
jgi:hypothetical protein